MLVFVTRRLVVSFFVLLASTALTYFLVAYSGNPLQDLLELRGPQRDAKIAQRTQDLNLDQPVWIRYLLWLGDVGRCISPFGGPCTLGSDRNGGEVLPQLQTAIGSTLRLVVVATILALILGVVTGIVTALRQYSVFDYGVTFVAFLCFSLPVFWVSTLLKQYVAIDLNTWLNNPTMTTGGILILGRDCRRSLGVGDRRRQTPDADGLCRSAWLRPSAVMYILLVTDFFRDPVLRHPGHLRFQCRCGGRLDSIVRRTAATRPSGVDFRRGNRRCRDGGCLCAAGCAGRRRVAARPADDNRVDCHRYGDRLVLSATRPGGWRCGSVGSPGSPWRCWLLSINCCKPIRHCSPATGGRPIKTTGSATPNL